MAELALTRIDGEQWEIPIGAVAGMRVPARVFADGELLAAIERDHSLEQLANVATLPGIVGASLAMPDIHQGYGFPVGGVAATAGAEGVISPGGVGYDINCGVRLLALPLTAGELGDRRESLIHELARRVPVGTGGRGAREGLRGVRLDSVLRLGPRALLDALGIGSEDELRVTESGGCLPEADPAAVPPRARERGATQIGTLGSGNHFLELDVVQDVHDAPAADAFGLQRDQLTVLIHSGSRGLGHQVCTDFVKRMDARLGHYGIHLPDRQLSCAPASSPEGRAYIAAMSAAANFAWANRAAIAHRVREALAAVLGPSLARGTRQVYEWRTTWRSSSTTAGRRCACTAKGQRARSPRAIRRSRRSTARPASPSSCPGAWAPPPTCWRDGQDRWSVRSGRRATAPAGACRGRQSAGRSTAPSSAAGSKRMASRCARRPRGLAEEAPEAYKDVERVVEVVERAGLAARVARLRPIGVVKG